MSAAVPDLAAAPTFWTSNLVAAAVRFILFARSKIATAMK
jgi:hypothetical protein